MLFSDTFIRNVTRDAGAHLAARAGKQIAQVIRNFLITHSMLIALDKSYSQPYNRIAADKFLLTY
jgi:hypothetical protein